MDVTVFERPQEIRGVPNLYTLIGDTRGRRSRMQFSVTSDAVFNSALTITVPSLNTAPLTDMFVFRLAAIHIFRRKGHED
jgi:hypothetical protein